MDQNPTNDVSNPPNHATTCGVSSAPGCSAVSVTVLDHPRGCLVCIDYDEQCLYLTAQEAQDLYEQLGDKMGQIPIGPIPPPHRYDGY